MAFERPDNSGLTEIQGLDGTTLRVIAVDASGRIIMLPYGVLTVDGTVDVVQVDSTREVQGIDGAVLRTLVVDGAGRLIMVPRGASGYYMNVDLNGYLSSVMKGLDGVTLRTIAVDASGNIIGILKGDYAGALKTLAVDGSGRMLAVLTDPEDIFGNAHQMGAAELAVRLGSIDSHDRRGQVIFMDDFECGHLNKWRRVTNGTLSAVSLSTIHCRNGAFSMYMYAGAANGSYSLVQHTMPQPTLKKVGFEAWYNFLNVNHNAYLDHTLYLYKGAVVVTFTIRYNANTKQVAYLDDGGAPQVFAINLDMEDPYHSHGFKLVVDLLAEKYVRCIINQIEYDLSTFAAQVSGNATKPCLVANVLNHDVTEEQGIWVDDVIITQNEV